MTLLAWQKTVPHTRVQLVDHAVTMVFASGGTLTVSGVRPGDFMVAHCPSNSGFAPDVDSVHKVDVSNALKYLRARTGGTYVWTWSRWSSLILGRWVAVFRGVDAWIDGVDSYNSASGSSSVSARSDARRSNRQHELWIASNTVRSNVSTNPFSSILEDGDAPSWTSIQNTGWASGNDHYGIWYRITDRAYARTASTAGGNIAASALARLRVRTRKILVPVPFATGAGTGVTLTPPAGIFSFTGNIPAVSTGVNIQPPAGSFTLSGMAPAVTSSARVDAPAGSLSFTGNAPAVATGVNVQPPAGSFAFTGNAPAVSLGVNVNPPAGTLTFTGNAPLLGAPVVVAAPAGVLSFTGNAPSVATGVNVQPPAGGLSFSGKIPTIATGVRVDAPAGSLTFTGNAPTVAEISIPTAAGGLEVVRLSRYMRPISGVRV